MKQKCYICGSSDTVVEGCNLPNGKGILSICVCQKCGHASRIEQPDFATNLKAQQKRFDDIAKKPKLNLRWFNRCVLVAAQMERIFRRGGKILDIGCGSGQWLTVLNDKWDKYGIEVSPKAAGIARQSTEANIFCGPFEDYDVEAETFDVITAFALIEHLKDPRKLLQWAFTHLKPSGIVILMTGDRESKVAKQMGYEWPLYFPPVHLHFFSCRSLEHLVTEAGFVVERLEWRSMSYGRGSLIELLILKTKEILRLLGKPHGDHLYFFARKLC